MLTSIFTQGSFERDLYSFIKMRSAMVRVVFPSGSKNGEEMKEDERKKVRKSERLCCGVRCAETVQRIKESMNNAEQ